MNNELIFQSVHMAGIKLNNRILRSATEEGLADEKGHPTEVLIKKYEALAKGGIGGIITSFFAVSEDGMAVMPGMVRIDSNSCIEPLQNMVERIHEFGCPIIAQIAHCGSMGISGRSARIDKLSDENITRIRDAFIDAAFRAEKAGFDGVQLHCAHGYFLSETLSASRNHRKDKWGGNEENRFRLTGEIIRGIRTGLPDYPVLVKINGEEQPANGIRKDEAARIAKRMEDAGASVIEVSRGITNEGAGPLWGKVPTDMILEEYPGVKGLPGVVKSIVKPVISKLMKSQPATRCYNLDSARAICDAVDIPIIVVGGIHDMDDIEKTILEEGFEYVSMSRPLILEPGLIGKYREGKSRKAKCIECNYCTMGLYSRPLKCYYGKVPKR